ncbi:MAG: nucleotidyltransferase family protein [Candidatus Sulfotelmatobacter sp.]|jgi:hypothetical protein
MTRNSAEAVVHFLRFSNDYANSIDTFKSFSTRKWHHVLQWLDDAGLALYFLRKLKDTNCADTIPAWALSRLAQNLLLNHERVDDLSHRFDCLNHRFNDAGIRYVVLKGFSLVPQYCSDASLRHQGDFDYLVGEQSLPAAQRVLLEDEYQLKPQLSAQELIFVKPSMGAPSRNHQQYSARSPHAVELHLDIWDSEQHRLPAMKSLFSVNRTITHQWGDLAFPVLTDDDAFLLQVLHACQHLFTYWIRMSSLFEISFFLTRHTSDSPLWNRIEQKAGDDPMLRDFFVIITELATKLFAAPVPRLTYEWSQQIRPATRIWIENYARNCAFCEMPAHEFDLFPRAKLVLFLLEQYKGDRFREDAVRKRLIAPSRFSRIALSIKEKPSLVWNLNWWKRQMLIRRSLFHALSGLRYFFEIPRWRWLNRASSAS